MSTALVKRTHFMTFELRNVMLYSCLGGYAKTVTDVYWKQNDLRWVIAAEVESKAKKRLSFWLVRWLTSKGIKESLVAQFGAKV